MNTTTDHTALSATTAEATSEDRPTREDKLDAARAVLAAGLSGVREDPEALARFLAFRAHFHEYSLNNSVLIWCQRPCARHCMGYRAWQAHGRQVRKGERGLTVLAPIVRKLSETQSTSGVNPSAEPEGDRSVVGFRTATVFDYAQTDAVAGSALVYTPPAPRLNAGDPAGLIPRLEAAATLGLGYNVVYGETGYCDGRCSFVLKTISVSRTLSPADRAAVLAHELCHALAHDPSGLAASGGETTARRELQAEGAAFVALAALGLDTSRASLPYLKGWARGDDAALGQELAAIDRIAQDLLRRVEATAVP